MALVKICGITTLSDAKLAVQLGADMIGCVVEPTSPRYISPEAAILIFNELPATITKVLVFGPLYDCPESHEATKIQYLSDPLGLGERLKVGVMRAMHLEELSNLPKRELGSQPTDQLIVLEPRVAGQYGGTGQQVDWDAAAKVVRETSYSVILAGGLTPANVSEAIAKVQPIGVDVSSGVELSPRVKDPAKLEAFIAASKAF